MPNFILSSSLGPNAQCPMPNSLIAMNDFSVPEKIDFEEAIALTQSLLERLEQGREEGIEAAVQKLTRTTPGARGFFVTYLTGDRHLADNPSQAVLRGLKSSPDIVAELLLKNLAMSSAMVVAHRRKSNEAMAKQSELVRERSGKLLQTLQFPSVPGLARELLNSARTGEGRYESFLGRWGYDAAQREAIWQSVELILDTKLPSPKEGNLVSNS